MTTIQVGNYGNALQTDRPAFEIKNDSFPVINNAHVWRGRIMKKRGVSQLGRLSRELTLASLGNSPANATWTFNIFSTVIPAITETNAQIPPANSIYALVITDGTDTFTDLGDGTLERQDLDVTSTINYTTGAVTLNRTVALANAFTISMFYFPNLPVMGIEDFDINFSVPGSATVPTTIFFDTKYSYQFTQAYGPFYDVNFFVATGLPFVWSGTDYQQFWTANYQGAMFATNNKPGFNFKLLTNTLAGAQSVIRTAATTVDVGLTANGLSNGDVVFINEVVGTLGTGSGITLDQNINGKTGIVSAAAANTFTITVAGANFQAGATGTGGIAQYLTNTIAGQDGIKFYIGDPTGPSLTKGWVNFNPPLASGTSPQYLVGAKIIIPFKNRLLFFGTWTQTSTGSAIYNPNQLVASQNGTVFYANVGLPANQSGDPSAFFQNVVGRGIRLNAPISQEVILVDVNGDVIIVVFEDQPLVLYSTGDDSAPLLYQTVSSEYGGLSTFSGVSLDVGVLSISPYGFTMTTQTGTERIDLTIPDQVFNINQDNHGIERVCVVRDFRNEFIYWTFPNNANSVNNTTQQIPWTYPTTTLCYNYRENNWSTYTETYTTYGSFRRSDSFTWATNPNETWAAWSNPWNFGQSQTKYPYVCCGNQQGFIMLRQDSTQESPSQYVDAINTTTLVVTSPIHNLNDGDFVKFTGMLGITDINEVIFKIQTKPSTPDSFILTLQDGQTSPAGTYIGGGSYSRLTNMYVQSRQFPLAWQNERQTILGTQRYLMEKTQNGQITLQLFVNQMNSLAANDPTYSEYLPFTNILLTSPEGNDLNLTQANQDAIWHRISTPVIGDTVQVGFTLSDDQMLTSYNEDEIIIYQFLLNVKPGPTLAN